jgi:metal-dependent amidase/aminoacylase/carboxypeptidase family protein
MTRIDLRRVRQVLDRLRRRLQAHPELRERTAEYLAETLPEEGNDEETTPEDRKNDR